MTGDTAALIAEARKTQGYSEGDLRSLVRSLADALQAATHKDSLTVRTVEELDALPTWSVVLDADETAMQSYGDGLWCGDGRDWETTQISPPATVLWVPDENGANK